MICSSVNLVCFIVRPQVGPDSNRRLKKHFVAGQTPADSDRAADSRFAEALRFRRVPAYPLKKATPSALNPSVLGSEPVGLKREGMIHRAKTER